MTKKEIGKLEEIWDIYSDMLECHMKKEKEREFSKMLILGKQLERILNEQTDKTHTEYSRKRLIEAIKKEIENA